MVWSRFFLMSSCLENVKVQPRASYLALAFPPRISCIINPREYCTSRNIKTFCLEYCDFDQCWPVAIVSKVRLWHIYSIVSLQYKCIVHPKFVLYSIVHVLWSIRIGIKTFRVRFQKPSIWPLKIQIDLIQPFKQPIKISLFIFY